jgi:hypothetical protein
MNVTATSALRILIRRRNSPAHLRGATRDLIRQLIAQMHAELRPPLPPAHAGR